MTAGAQGGTHFFADWLFHLDNIAKWVTVSFSRNVEVSGNHDEKLKGLDIFIKQQLKEEQGAAKHKAPSVEDVLIDCRL